MAAIKDGFGFIETLQHDKEIFFHFSNIEGKGDKLEVSLVYLVLGALTPIDPVRFLPSSLRHFRFGISYVWTFDLYGPPVRNAFDAGKSITRTSGRGLGPGNDDFFGAL